jgi:hypothetical protein
MKTSPVKKTKAIPGAPGMKKIEAAVMKEIFPDMAMVPANPTERTPGRFLHYKKDPDDRRDLFHPMRGELRVLARQLESEDDFLMQKNLNHERFLYTRLDQFKKLILSMARVILNE